MKLLARFISIEGGEGVGKSLFIRKLSEALKERQLDHLLTREPGGTLLGDRVRQLFLAPPEGEALSARAELLLISAARSQHVNLKIKPALAQGRWVLCDRFYDSTRVYQGQLAGIASQELESIIAYSIDGCHPHLTFVLDCPATVAMQRVAIRAGAEAGPMNRYDGGSVAFYEKLRSAYLDLARAFPERVRVLDASQNPDQLLQDALAVLPQAWFL